MVRCAFQPKKAVLAMLRLPRSLTIVLCWKSGCGSVGRGKRFCLFDGGSIWRGRFSLMLFLSPEESRHHLHTKRVGVSSMSRRIITAKACRILRLHLPVKSSNVHKQRLSSSENTETRAQNQRTQQVNDQTQRIHIHPSSLVSSKQISKYQHNEVLHCYLSRPALRSRQRPSSIRARKKGHRSHHGPCDIQPTSHNYLHVR